MWYEYLREIDVQYSSNQPIQKPSQSNLNAERRIQKAYIRIDACTWMEAVSAKKKLQIKKYLDTCGRGLSTIWLYLFLA